MIKAYLKLACKAIGYFCRSCTWEFDGSCYNLVLESKDFFAAQGTCNVAYGGANLVSEQNKTYHCVVRYKF